MIRMTVYAGAGENDELSEYKPSVVTHLVEESQLSDELRKIGLEWKLSDYFSSRQTVITLDPVESKSDTASIKELVREAAETLEKTGLLSE
jgi:hypothetical protein